MFDGILPAEDRPLGDPETPGNVEGLLRGSLFSLFVKQQAAVSDQVLNFRPGTDR